MIYAFNRTQPGDPVVLSQERRQLQRLQMVGEQDLRCVGHTSQSSLPRWDENVRVDTVRSKFRAAATDLGSQSFCSSCDALAGHEFQTDTIGAWSTETAGFAIEKDRGPGAGSVTLERSPKAVTVDHWEVSIPISAILLSERQDLSIDSNVVRRGSVRTSVSLVHKWSYQ